MKILKPKIRVALDIGTNFIKLVQLEISSTGAKLLDAGLVEIGYDPSVADAEGKTKTIEAIQRLLKEKHIKAKKIILAVPGQSAISRFLRLPPGSENKVDSIIKYEARHQIPLPLYKMVVDYQVLNQGKKGVDVILLAIKEEIVNNYLNIVGSMGLTPEVVDVSSLALFNSLSSGQDPKTDEVVALIDIGATTTDLCIQKGEILSFARSFPIGGNELTEALCAKLGIDFREAERLKREVTIPSEPTTGKGKTRQISEAVDSFAENLVAGIRHSFDFYQSQPGGAPVNRIVLSGGSAKLKGLDEFLARKLRLQLEIANPFQNIQFDSSELNPEAIPFLTIAIGLALREKIRINLLPLKVREKQQIKKRKKIFTIAAAALIILLLAANIILLSQTSGVKSQLKEIEKEETASLVVKRIQHLKAEDEKINEKIDLINFKLLEQAQWSPIIYEISKLTPEKVWLSKIVTISEPGGGKRKAFQTEEEREIKIGGSASSHYYLSRFMSNLENSPSFVRITLGSTQKREEKEWIDFGITCQLHGRSGE